MTKKIVDLPRVAEVTIEQVLDEFLADQQKRLKPKTFKQYEDVVGLFKNSMNSYAYQSLTKAEKPYLRNTSKPRAASTGSSARSSVRIRSLAAWVSFWAII